MKSLKYFILLCFVASAFMACNKDFLNRYPQTSITAQTFFKSASDLQTYSNTFYTQLVFPYSDVGSDNTSFANVGGEMPSLLSGTLSPANVSGDGAANNWNQDTWGNLRTLNYLLDNASSATGDTAAINSYIGIAHFFRAWFYFNMVKRYSNVPWYSHAMSNTDASLYKTEDPRSLVMDSVLNDLQYAVDHITQASNEDYTRVTKWSALALMSRVCLFEGTYRKYHAEIGLQNDYTRFLQKAEWASQQIISSGLFGIYNTGGGALDFRALFQSPSLSGNKEMLLWGAYNSALSQGNNTHTVLGWTWALSRSLEETYLMKDGSRFTDIPRYDTIGFVGVFNNRDPRLAETFAYPGYSTTNNNSYYIPSSAHGGYDQLKYFPRDPAQRGGWFLDNSALPMFRYAEVLLNLIEAKAEVGENIAQSDLDGTINLLRDRVKMPHLTLVTALSNPDAVLQTYYPNVSGALASLVLEIRRERRVELACEGLRFDDLQRWYAGKRIGDAPQGMYVPHLGGLDVTGDGLPDIAILPSTSDSSALNSLTPAQRANISARFYLLNNDGSNNGFYLINGTYGNIAFTTDRDGVRSFIEPKYYYRPIPQSEIVLNPKLTQPYGWQ